MEGKLDADSLIMELGTLENSQSLLEEKLSNSKRDIERALKEEFANTEEIFLSQVTKLKDSNVKRMEEFDDLEEVKDFCESLRRNLQRRISNFAKNADDKMRIIVHDIVIFVHYLFAVYVKFGDSCLTVRRSAEDHLILFTVSGSACESDLVGAEVEPPFGLLEIVVESLTVTLAFQLDVFIQLEIVV